MAGRGRGRGKSSMSFDIGRLGFGSGEALPKASVQPPALYPPLQTKTTPLSSTEVDEYLLALSQEYRGSIRDSPFFIKPKTVKRDIVRYTDRYKQNQNKADKKFSWEPDWNFVPKELKPSKKREAGSVKAKVNLSAAVRKETASNEVDVVKKLETLEKIASKVDSKGETENAENAEENEEYDEEEYEDDNDYNFDHYDDGGDRYGDEDDGEDGPVY